MDSRNIGRTVLFIGFAILAGLASAEEGMWPLYDLIRIPLDSLRSYGLTLPLADVYNPGNGGLSDAVISLSGGTASFVSAKGLLITNHHVAYDAIQENTTVEHNYLRDGFYAPTMSDEIRAPGYNINTILSIDDVTGRVLASVTDNLSAKERFDAIDKATKEIVKEAEAGRDVRCSIADMHGGTQYMLYTYFRIKDVRLVYAPPEAIGNYGGDIDNWMWPRHVGDFCFLRAYVAPDGSAAEYSKGNVPYRPKRFLPVSSAGVREGDFTMMIGFPGSTQRYKDSYSVNNLISFYYPMLAEALEAQLKIIGEASKQDSAVAIRMAADVSHLSNSLKRTEATLDGFRRTDILAAKKKQEAELMQFLASRPDLKGKYGRVLSEFDSLQQTSWPTRYRDFALGRLTTASDFLRMASMLYKWAVEREKSDLERETGYQSRDSARARERLVEAQTNLVPSVDMEFFKHFMRMALKLPPDQKIDAIEKLFAGESDAEKERHLATMADDFYSRTHVGELESRLNMFSMTKAELEKSDDPFVQLAISLRPLQDKIHGREEEISGARSRLDPLLIQAYVAWKDGYPYPDANGTMRLSYGRVEGYAPKDAVRYDYITTLTGVMEKETGVEPFVVPKELKLAYQQGGGGNYNDPGKNGVPVDFLTTNDGTGGNSGSPVLNGRGELIGLDFDSNYESVAKDYWYLPEISRSIVVDIRYVLYIIDRVYHLENLLNELTIH